MMLAQSLEDIARRHTRPRIGKRLVDAPAERYRPCRGIRTGFRLRFDAFLKIADGGGNKAPHAWHGDRSLLRTEQL
jgi:hypothetical protein